MPPPPILILCGALFLWCIHSSEAKSTFHYTKRTEKMIVYPKDNKFVTFVICKGTSPEKSSGIYEPYSEN